MKIKNNVLNTNKQLLKPYSLVKTFMKKLSNLPCHKIKIRHSEYLVLRVSLPLFS